MGRVWAYEPTAPALPNQPGGIFRTVVDHDSPQLPACDAYVKMECLNFLKVDKIHGVLGSKSGKIRIRFKVSMKLVTNFICLYHLIC